MPFATIAYLWLDVAVHGSICITSWLVVAIQGFYQTIVLYTAGISREKADCTGNCKLTQFKQLDNLTTMSSPQNLRRTFMRNWFAVEVGYPCGSVYLCADSFNVRLFRCEWSVLLIWILERLDFCIQLCDYWRRRSWC